MSGAPYMRFYFGDYDRDTGHLRGALEHGVYFMLIKAMWNAGGRLPADDKRLARLAQVSDKEWASVKDVILPFFKRRGGHLRHKRIDAELAVYHNTLEHARRGGKASARQKAKKNNEKSSTPVERPLNQPEPEPEDRIEGLLHSPSPILSGAGAAARHEGATDALRLVILDKPPIEERKRQAQEAIASLRSGTLRRIG